MRSAILQVTAIVLTGVAFALLVAGPVKPGQSSFADRTVVLSDMAVDQAD